MRWKLLSRSFVDTVAEDGAIDLNDFYRALAVGAGDEEGHSWRVALGLLLAALLMLLMRPLFLVRFPLLRLLLPRLLPLSTCGGGSMAKT